MARPGLLRGALARPLGQPVRVLLKVTDRKLPLANVAIVRAGRTPRDDHEVRSNQFAILVEIAENAREGARLGFDEHADEALREEVPRALQRDEHLRPKTNPFLPPDPQRVDAAMKCLWSARRPPSTSRMPMSSFPRLPLNRSTIRSGRARSMRPRSPSTRGWPACRLRR